MKTYVSGIRYHRFSGVWAAPGGSRNQGKMWATQLSSEVSFELQLTFLQAETRPTGQALGSFWGPPGVSWGLREGLRESLRQTSGKTSGNASGKSSGNKKFPATV